jgi:hypothetical protein
VIKIDPHKFEALQLSEKFSFFASEHAKIRQGYMGSGQRAAKNIMEMI